MSTLTVVRHGQARPFEDNPDRLSALGEQQARALAAYWNRFGTRFDESYCGSLLRQQQTAELACPLPPRVSDDWNEYDSGGILRHFAPPYEFEEGADRNRRFQKIFEPAMTAWLETPSHDLVETWSTFRGRVLRALRAIQDGGSNRSVVVFTSGGPISLLVHSALSAPDRSFLEINWRVKNCSITEFTFSRDRLSLDSFNALPHLEAPELRTFR